MTSLSDVYDDHETSEYVDLGADLARIEMAHLLKFATRVGGLSGVDVSVGPAATDGWGSVTVTWSDDTPGCNLAGTIIPAARACGLDINYVAHHPQRILDNGPRRYYARLGFGRGVQDGIRPEHANLPLRESVRRDNDTRDGHKARRVVTPNRREGGEDGRWDPLSRVDVWREWDFSRLLSRAEEKGYVREKRLPDVEKALYQ